MKLKNLLFAICLFIFLTNSTNTFAQSKAIYASSEENFIQISCSIKAICTKNIDNSMQLDIFFYPLKYTYENRIYKADTNFIIWQSKVSVKGVIDGNSNGNNTENVYKIISSSISFDNGKDTKDVFKDGSIRILDINGDNERMWIYTTFSNGNVFDVVLGKQSPYLNTNDFETFLSNNQFDLRKIYLNPQPKVFNSIEDKILPYYSFNQTEYPSIEMKLFNILFF